MTSEPLTVEELERARKWLLAEVAAWDIGGVGSWEFDGEEAIELLAKYAAAHSRQLWLEAAEKAESNLVIAQGATAPYRAGWEQASQAIAEAFRVKAEE